VLKILWAPQTNVAQWVPPPDAAIAPPPGMRLRVCLLLLGGSKTVALHSRPGLVDVASQPVLTGSRSSDLRIASQPIITGWSRLADGRFTGVLGDHTVWLHATSVGYLPGLEQRIAFIESRGGRIYQLGRRDLAAMLSVPELSVPEQARARFHMLARLTWPSPRSLFPRPTWSTLSGALSADLLPKLSVTSGGAVLLLLAYLAISTPDVPTWDYMYF
jgi:hypothetical protein